MEHRGYGKDIDMDGKEDGPLDFVTVPEGTYLCKVEEVRIGTTRAGDDRWGMRLQVAEGEHVGKVAAWDGLVFSTRGVSRARRVLACLGYPTRGKIRIDPSDLVGRRAFVQIRQSEFPDPMTGKPVRRNEVPYDGYMPAPEEGGGDGGDREPVPARKIEEIDAGSIPF